MTCILALAFLVPLAAGVYDLSVAAVMSLSLCISVYLSLNTDLSPAVGAFIALAARSSPSASSPASSWSGSVSTRSSPLSAWHRCCSPA